MIQVTSPDKKTSGTTLQKSINYQGRKAARAKSEHRRRLILEATLRIVAREGVRGIKHRAVAKEAGVPLASTTYYFKDIEELISDAFMLFAEKSQQVLDLFYGELNKLVNKYDVKLIRSDELTRIKFTEDLMEMGARYIKAQVQFRRDDLMAEMAFLMEAVRDEHLKPLAKDYKQVWYTRLIEFLKMAGTPAPEEESILVISAVQGLLYEGVLNDGEVDEAKVRGVLKRAVGFFVQAP